jgi:hypothetical protein
LREGKAGKEMSAARRNPGRDTPELYVQDIKRDDREYRVEEVGSRMKA